MRASAVTLEELLLNGGLVVGYDDTDPPPTPDPDKEEDEDEDEDEDDDSDEGTEQDRAALKTALQAERKRARDLEKANKKLERAQKKIADKDLNDTEQARTEAADAKASNLKLADRLRTTSVDNLITKNAGKLKFRDLDDALRLVDRSKIEVDQDEDDPADIEVDEPSVMEALKALAKLKPHLLLAAGDDGPSGGNLGSKDTKNKGELDDEALRNKYPALRRG